MSEAKIIVEDFSGVHNRSDYQARLLKAKTYEDQSTVCVVPTRGVISARVVQNWMGMITPMNQKFTRMFISGLEVGEAYEQAVSAILANPELSKWRYMLTLEEDNLVPPDGLLKLIENIGSFDAIGGLYWTKGEGGQPMCYGNPALTPISFIPQIPIPEQLTECCGLGMGFTLFKIESLRKLKAALGEKKMFETRQYYDPQKGCELMTQDLYHFQKGRENGLRYACAAMVKVGHYDAATDIVW